MKRFGGNIYGGDVATDPEIAEKLTSSREINQGHYRRQQLAATNSGMFNFLRLPLIDNPTLIMHGDDDPIAQYPNAVAMHMLIPNSRLHRVNKGGHLFLMTRPEESAKTINNFLDS